MTKSHRPSGWGWVGAVSAVAALTFLSTVVLTVGGAAAAPPEGKGEIYVVHGLAGVTADILVDGQVQQSAAQPRTVVGPLTLEPGSHTVTLQPGEGAPLAAAVNVAAGASLDVVAHSAADAASPPVLTVFPNDLSAVGAGKSRLVVAHTAVVPPADVRVDQVVLFSNVANAESLELLVPAGSYSVDIVPTGTTSPVVFGPVQLPVQAGTLTRVFAFGDPTRQSMDAVVHVLPVAQEGAAPPASMPMGNGGQAAATDPDVVSWAGGLVAALALLGAVGGLVRRRRVQVLRG